MAGGLYRLSQLLNKQNVLKTSDTLTQKKGTPQKQTAKKRFLAPAETVYRWQQSICDCQSNRLMSVGQIAQLIHIDGLQDQIYLTRHKLIHTRWYCLPGLSGGNGVLCRPCRSLQRCNFLCDVGLRAVCLVGARIILQSQ